MPDSGNETLRWPTNLDRQGIIERLVKVRALAEAAGLKELSERFAAVETMSNSEIGASVVAALTWIQEKPGQDAITLQLSMVAMNLKNLK
ncbi:MAG: hypothetical protein AB1452_13390 [Pseudomonadota bacterium]